MTQELNRIKKLAGMLTESELQNDMALEANNVSEIDYDDDGDDSAEQYAREKKVAENIRFAVEKVGMELKSGNGTNVFYSEGDDEVDIHLEETVEGWDLNKFVALAQSGIGSNFKIGVSGLFIQVRFTINPDLAYSTPA